MKGSSQELKEGLADKDMKSKWGNQGTLLLKGLKFFDHDDDLIAKYRSQAPAVDGIISF